MSGPAHRPRAQRTPTKELRALGCVCHPKVSRLPAANVASVGASAGWHVAHRPGCPLGDRFVAANLAGVTPTIYTWAGCQP